MISSIMLASLVGAAAFVAYRSFNVTYSSTRASRIKAKQAVMEAQVRRRAIQPEAYQDCDSGVTNRCHVRPEFFTDLNDQHVQGANCGAQGIGNCGLSVKNLAFDPTSRQFSAYVGYDGGEVNIKPVAVQLTVPTEVLQSPVFNCGLLDPLKPIFTGFDTNNQPQCEGFTACDKGSFVAGIDIGTRKLTCKPLPTSISCPQQNMFTHLGWAGGDVRYSCGELPDPPFTSRLNTRPVASVDPTGTPTFTEPFPSGDGTGAGLADGGAGSGAGAGATAAADPGAGSTGTDPSTGDLHWYRQDPGGDYIPGFAVVMVSGGPRYVQQPIAVIADMGQQEAVYDAGCPPPSAITNGNPMNYLTTRTAPFAACSQSGKLCRFTAVSAGATVYTFEAGMAFVCR